ncbi:MAG TPA: hypothetical protein VHA37_03710, partial [Candidatus Saccharimonadales bacterium]|nr:hypothetical protein [Candidatus Saccharimonadales bacterium]
MGVKAVIQGQTCFLLRRMRVEAPNTLIECEADKLSARDAKNQPLKVESREPVTRVTLPAGADGKQGAVLEGFLRAADYGSNGQVQLISKPVDGEHRGFIIRTSAQFSTYHAQIMHTHRVLVKEPQDITLSYNFVDGNGLSYTISSRAPMSKGTYRVTKDEHLHEATNHKRQRVEDKKDDDVVMVAAASGGGDDDEKKKQQQQQGEAVEVEGR